jgi:hypothetical protein
MIERDPNLKRPMQKLHQLTVYGRWFVVAFCWLSLGSFGIWGLREEIPLWQEYFTWTAVRYGLAYHVPSTFCLAFCLGLTMAVLIWQSRNILWGMPTREKQRLEKQVKKIYASGPTHPLWNWTFGASKR